MFRSGDFWISWGGWEFGVPKRDGAETPSAESGFISSSFVNPPSWHYGGQRHYGGREHFGGQVGKELNLNSENFIFLALFAGLEMTIGRTPWHYCTLIYALFLLLFRCLATCWKKLKIWRGLGPRIGDRRQGRRSCASSKPH